MKTLIILVVGLLSIGCLTPEQKQKALRDSVVGEYVFKDEDGNTYKEVFLDNGVLEGYINGDKLIDYKWSIVNGEIHAQYDYGIGVYRINPDKSITEFASINLDGKRTDRLKEKQSIYF